MHRDTVWKRAKSCFPVAPTIVRKQKHGLKIMFLVVITEGKLIIKHECEPYKKDQLQQTYATKESGDMSDLYRVHENQTSICLH